MPRRAFCTRRRVLIVAGVSAVLTVPSTFIGSAAEGLDAAQPVTTAPAESATTGPAGAATQAEPGNVDDAVRLAEAYVLEGRIVEAERALRPWVQEPPAHEGWWCVWIDLALRNEQWATALERGRTASRRLGPSPTLSWRLAQAYFGLGKLLGSATVREVSEGRAGQFRGRWLLVEARGPGRFLCCPEASALYQLRRALDGGLDDPAAHVLHARLWRALGRPHVALGLLKSHETRLLENPDIATLEVFAELALETDAPADFLRYARQRAGCEPQRRRELLAAAYARLAEYYGRRGDAVLHREFSHRALRLGAQDVELMLPLADAEWASGRRAAAAELYRRVLALEPAHAERTRILERLADWQAERPR